MSLEQQIARLTDAIEENNRLLKSGATVAGAVNTASTETTHEAGATSSPEKVEVNWYHNPDEKKVWAEEGPAKRRKGITRVDEGTAKRLIAQYEEEAATEQEEETSGGDLDGDGFGMDLGDEEDAPKYDESKPIDKEEFAAEWNGWTKAAIQHALDTGAPSKEEAQTEVKKFIVPLVKSLTPKGEKPAVASIPEDLRARFLNKAQDFFNS